MEKRKKDEGFDILQLRPTQQKQQYIQYQQEQVELFRKFQRIIIQLNLVHQKQQQQLIQNYTNQLEEVNEQCKKSDKIFLMTIEQLKEENKKLETKNQIIQAEKEQLILQNKEQQQQNINKDETIRSNQKDIDQYIYVIQTLENETKKDRKAHQSQIETLNYQIMSLNQEKIIQQTSLVSDINKYKTQIDNITQELQKKNQIINQSQYLEWENQLNKIAQKQQIKQQDIVSLQERPFEIINKIFYGQSCTAIAFNKESTIMVAGCKDIIVFEFEQGQLKQQQILSDHTSKNIRTLYFMTKSNQFISGTNMKIGIWSYNDTTNQYYLLQMLKQGHSGQVNTVIMTKNEDLIISCSSDKTIKFWIKTNEWECSQTLTNHTNCVCDICLNESCTQLVSCGQDYQILISQQGGDQKWSVIQKIQVATFGRRICYINDNLIVFQPDTKINMQLYKFDLQNKQFIQYKDVSVQNDHSCQIQFPMKFNSRKSIILNKNGKSVNLIRKNNNDFIVEQTINFNRCCFYCTMTNDFEYLVICNNESNELQIWKQK